MYSCDVSEKARTARLVTVLLAVTDGSHDAPFQRSMTPPAGLLSREPPTHSTPWNDTIVNTCSSSGGAGSAVHVVPRSSLLGAVLLTGYLGGAVATHLRLGNPLYSHTLFPVYVGLFVWGGLVLRDSRLRNLFPVRRAD